MQDMKSFVEGRLGKAPALSTLHVHYAYDQEFGDEEVQWIRDHVGEFRVDPPFEYVTDWVFNTYYDD
jgi:hypothetical protein